MKRIFLFAICIVFFQTVSVRSIAQTSISDIINVYSPIDSVYPTKDTIRVANSADFNDGDTVMIYQVKGAEVWLNPSQSNLQHWGRVTDFSNAMHNTGKYEIIIIQEVLSATVIRLRTRLDKEYDHDQPMQIISVPSYKSASVDATVTCKAWDGSSGGVLALMVEDTLHMNANIDVSGKGFRGAVPYEINAVCASTDSATYASYFFAESADTISAGFKGEGITMFDPAYRKGKGRWATGGGGANGRYSGGGGGGYMDAGGMGGAEDTTTCVITYFRDSTNYGLGGAGGFGFTGGFFQLINDSTVLMGGGGGSGTYFGPLTATTGGNGGGIIILMVRNLKANGFEIKADGESVLTAATASGAGGGAGGTVGFDVDTVIEDNVYITIQGGAGGNSQFFGESGPGGGGSGGLIYWKGSLPSDITSFYFDNNNTCW